MFESDDWTAVALARSRCVIAVMSCVICAATSGEIAPAASLPLRIVTAPEIYRIGERAHHIGR